jgi:hypothetical protein
MALLNLSPEEQKARSKVYTRLERMRELKNKKFPHFSNQYGERSFTEYIDDSERILNGYTLSREAQGKEDWQSNMLDNLARAKLRGIVAGIGTKVPDMRFQAVDDNGVQSSVRAEIFKHITKQTFLDGNPVLHNFLETWTLLSHGFVAEYEGYKTGGAKVRCVESFDSRTGAVTETTKYVEGEAKPFSTILNPQEFYWWDMFIRDIQEQPHLAWVQHYTKKELEFEFSKFPNYKFLKDKKQAGQFGAQQETLYYTEWSSRVDSQDDYEVIRFYSLEDDAYEIWVNGIPLLRAPMLWGYDEKYYPFATAICEPFANTNFAVGMSLAGILEAYQDSKNTIINTMIDKLYRSMEVPLLVGLQNKDLLDFESEFVSQDNRYYVPDVNAVKPMPIAGVNQGELAMLQIIDRGIESLSIDRSQQGLQPNVQRTARDAVIADRNAQQLKTMLYLFQEDLWLQKTRLRTKNILTHFIKDVAARKTLKDNIITVNDYSFVNGERGTLDIHIAKNRAALLPEAEIMAREQAAEQQGQTYKLISILQTYMDDWDLDFQIIPESFHQEDKTAQEEAFKEEVQIVTTLFPEFFVANKDKYLSQALKLFGKHPDEFNAPAQLPPQLGAPQDPNAPAAQSQPAPTQQPQPTAQPDTVQSLLGLQ